MARIPANQRQPGATRTGKITCESFGFAEVEFPLPIRPRLVVRFSDGLSLLLEDESAIALAAEFIDSFRRHEKGGRK